MAFLVFQIQAPLASFGSVLGACSFTDSQPRKSVITGMLGAALGITRHQEDDFTALVNAVRLAVLTLQEPIKGSDFQSIQSPVKLSTYPRYAQISEIQRTPQYSGTTVEHREFLQGGHWLVALQGDKALLDKWAQALAFPHFVLYAGRKSFVLSAYTAPYVSDATVVEQAMQEWAGHSIGLPSLPENGPMQWDVNVSVNCTATIQTTRHDVRTHLLHNHFAPRLQNEGVALFQKSESACT